MYVSLSGCVHLKNTEEGIAAPPPLELELQVRVSYQTRVLGTELRPSARTASTLNY